jgi:hypothetical protein
LICPYVSDDHLIPCMILWSDLSFIHVNKPIIYWFVNIVRIDRTSFGALVLMFHNITRRNQGKTTIPSQLHLKHLSLSLSLSLWHIHTCSYYFQKITWMRKPVLRQKKNRKDWRLVKARESETYKRHNRGEGN